MLIFLEVIFSGMHSVNYMEHSNLGWFLKLLTVLTREIFNDGERWQLRSPGLLC